MHKRLWEVSGERVHLDITILACERGCAIRTDFYSGVKLALLFRCGGGLWAGRAVADFGKAERVRRRVIPLCEAALASATTSDTDRYWAEATMAEAYVGIGDEEASATWLARAMAEPVAEWMRESAVKQLDSLRPLLTPSPLDMITPR